MLPASASLSDARSFSRPLGHPCRGNPLRKRYSAADAASPSYLPDPEAGLAPLYKPGLGPAGQAARRQDGTSSAGAGGGARRWLRRRVSFAEQSQEKELLSNGAVAAPALAPRLRGLHRAFVSAPDVFALSSAGGLPKPPPSPPPESSVGDEEGGEAGEVVLLYSKGQGGQGRPGPALLWVLGAAGMSGGGRVGGDTRPIAAACLLEKCQGVLLSVVCRHATLSLSL